MYKRREPTLKVCKHCKTEYMSNHLRQKYCSSSCCTLAFYERNGTEPVKKRLQSLDFNLNNLGVVAAGSAISTTVLELFKEKETKLPNNVNYELERIEAKLDNLSDVLIASIHTTLELGDERVIPFYNQKFKSLRDARKSKKLLQVKK